VAVGTDQHGLEGFAGTGRGRDEKNCLIGFFATEEQGINHSTDVEIK